jgi:hypothetical protein
MKIFLYRQWADWQAAWRRMREERRRHDDKDAQCISVPWARYCDLLLAEERAKALAVNLAVERERLVREQRLSEVLGAILFQVVEEECEAGPQNVARLELVAPARNRFDS